MKQTRHKRRRRYRKNRVAELRNKGMSYTEIADKLGVSESTVYRAKASNQNAVVFFSEGTWILDQSDKKYGSQDITGWLVDRINCVAFWAVSAYNCPLASRREREK